MINIALNKLPVEKEIWQRPEEATNGVILNYDGYKGFAFATWPCTYTIDLETEYNLNTIRFLLWDGLGKPINRVDSRKYKFSLGISSDGVNFTTIYTNNNKNQEGGNGWYSFRFLNVSFARYIKFTGHFNSANKDIHIVEFEVYDEEPIKVNSSNFKNFDLITGIPGEQRINELINQSISDKGGILVGVESKILELNTAIDKSREALKQNEIIKKSSDFLTESEENRKRAQNWLITAICTFVIFVLLLIYFICYNNYPSTLIIKYSKDINLKPYTILLISTYYVSKALLLSTILFILSWFLKNYRSEKHNYVINKHKAMSLTVAIGILTKDEFSGTKRDNILMQAMDIIFTHQVSGFSKEDSTSPSIINTLLQREIPE